MTEPSEARDLSVHLLAAEHRPAVLELASDPTWAVHNYLRIFGSDAAGVEQRDRVERSLGCGAHLVAVAGGQVVGFVGWQRNEDLSHHFDVAVHETGPLLVHPASDRHQVASMLLAAVRDDVAARGGGLVVHRSDAQDATALAAAQDQGFAVRDVLLTFINDLERSGRNAGVPDSFPHIEVVELDGRTDWLTDDDVTRLRVGAQYLVHDHYHRDPLLDDDRCDQLYLRLLDRSIAGEGADVAVVYRHTGALLGVGFWRTNRALEALGVSLADGSFGLRLPGGPPEVVSDEFSSFICNRPIVGNRILEWSTHATNLSQVNMTTRERSIRLCRSAVTLHCWTGPTSG
ncbi:GNAT family N-acetyltransferase [Aquihabitans daechungensis]|uniref:GNAT family N-acetyltransferase n=1 Tax=Aquihabitans daechungensis TaxID=1052257 RepID=UPI003B9F03FE